MRKASDLTATDQFCGAGGSSIGAERAGVRLRMALNHWPLAIETHNTNFPHADHDCTDISACDPRRYPSTNILITSPECTNHSLAKGKRRKGLDQRDMFTPAPACPSEERSRATMWDVCRFTEYHGYELVIVENVVDARHWVGWNGWLRAMHDMGYAHRCVYLNSMFCHPTPQSRDRMYVVFWKKGNRAPDLEYRPEAYCTRCARDVEAVQSWKPGRHAGRYRQQYVYCCSACTTEVTPYYFAALNAIDWTIPAERIGDRERPLRQRTLERIRYGLERYGRHPLQVITNMTTDGGRVRTLLDPGFTQTGSALTALVHPFFVDTAFGQNGEKAASSGYAPLRVQTTRQTFGIALPFLTTAGSRETGPTSTVGAIPTLTGSDRFGVTFSGAVAALRDYRTVEQLVYGLDEALTTQVGASQHAVLSQSPFLVKYNRTGTAHGVGEELPTVTTLDRLGLVEPNEDLSVEDCYFRMLQPHEIGAGMAFPADYQVLGNKRDRVKQYGNAVTPPAMEWLVGRGVESLS